MTEFQSMFRHMDRLLDIDLGDAEYYYIIYKIL